VPMTKEHKIRIACRGLSGQVREETKLALMQYPEKIDRAMAMRMRYFHRDGARKPRPGEGAKRDVNIHVRMSYADYAEVKRIAKSRCQTIASLVRQSLGITQLEEVIYDCQRNSR